LKQKLAKQYIVLNSESRNALLLQQEF